MCVRAIARRWNDTCSGFTSEPVERLRRQQTRGTRSGDLLAEVVQKEGLEIARVSKAFANDVLLALSCREAGCVLVTENERDFQRIRRFVQFDFMKPWPGRQVS